MHQLPLKTADFTFKYKHKCIGKAMVTVQPKANPMSILIYLSINHKSHYHYKDHRFCHYR